MLTGRPMEWYQGLTLAGIVAIIGLLVKGIQAIYDRGGKEATDNKTITDNVRRITEVEACLKDLKSVRQVDREADRVMIENRFAAIHGGVALLKDQVAEFRTEVTRVYATREEASKIEERLNSALTRLFAHIDTLSKDLRNMNAQIIEAISDRNHAIDTIRKKIEP